MAQIRFSKAPRPRQAAFGFRWDEAQHPRGVGGKFASKPGAPQPGQPKAGKPPVRAAEAPRPAAMEKPTVRFGREDLRFTAADKAHAPLTVMVKQVAAATNLFEPMALWVLPERDVMRLRAECERNDDEVGLMMVDVHRNMRRSMTPAEVADARATVVAMLKQARARAAEGVVKGVPFDAVRHPRYPKGHPKGGQFRPTGGASASAPITRADFIPPPTLGYLERERPVQLGVNVAEVWGLFASKSYGSPEQVAAIAIREALQNSRDACMKAGGGKITFGLDLTEHSAWFEDTGVGMDADTLQDKFLVIGASGKREEEGAVGGFGVAKAVILSLSDPPQGGHWAIHTRNLALTDEEVAAGEARFRVVPERQGTRLDWSNISADAWWGVTRAKGARRYMQCSDTGKIRMELNENTSEGWEVQPISSLSMVRRKPIAETSFNGGETTVRVYKVNLAQENAARKQRGEDPIAIDEWSNVVIRLDGIAQVFQGSRAPGCYVVDVTTTARPGSNAYPFDPHRTMLKSEVGGSWLRDKLEELVVREKTSAQMPPVDKIAGCDLRARDQTDEHAAAFSRLLRALEGQEQRWGQYAGKYRKTGIVPPLIYQAMTHAEGVSLWKVYGSPVSIEDLSRYDLSGLATYFEGPVPSRGGRPQLTAKQLAGLIITQYYMTAVASRLSGRASAHPIPINAIYRPDVAASFSADRFDVQTIGVNVSLLNEAMADPHALNCLLFHEAVHEYAHLVAPDHDTKFVAVQGEISRGLWNIEQDLWEDTQRLWAAFTGKAVSADAVVGVAASATGRRSRRPATEAAAAQPVLFKGIVKQAGPLALVPDAFMPLVAEAASVLEARALRAMVHSISVLSLVVYETDFPNNFDGRAQAARWAVEIARDLPLTDAAGDPWIAQVYAAVRAVMFGKSPRDPLRKAQVAFDEAKHPRHPAGHPEGGQFRRGPGAAVAARLGMQPVPMQREEKSKQRAKYEQCLRVGQKLPALERHIDRDLNRKDTPREKSAAAVVYLMRHLMMRVGSERYARENETFGASSLRVEHVRVDGDRLEFNFTGKTGVPWQRAVVDPRLATFITGLRANAPGGRLFWYRGPGGEQLPLTERHVQEWMKTHGLRPKDLRTWHANVRMFEELERRATPEGQKRTRKQLRAEITAAFEVVAEEMGHDPGTCRGQYVFPPLWQTWLENGGRLAVEKPFAAGYQPLQKAAEEIEARLGVSPTERRFLAWLQAYGQKAGLRKAGLRTRLWFRKGRQPFFDDVALCTADTEVPAPATWSEQADQTFAELGTCASEWHPAGAVDLQHGLMPNGGEAALSDFSWPEGYRPAPTPFRNTGTEGMRCELCGRHPLKYAYYLQHDGKRLIMLVGSECISKHIAATLPPAQAEAVKQELQANRRRLRRRSRRLTNRAVATQDRDRVRP